MSSSASYMPNLVLVTGANGFIGSSLVKALLEQGYCVRGTLRDCDISNESETGVLKAMPNASTHLELVPLELEGPEDTFNKALQDVEWVFHVASPVSVAKIKDEQTIIGPAVTGTLNMLRAANATSTVRKFVLTSSIAAIVSGQKKSYTEYDWASGVDGPDIIAYFKSKALSEQAAWKFMKDNTPRFSLSVINPGFVMGPIPSANVKSTSDIIAGILRGGGICNLFFSVVDIRDVVKAHIQAAKVPEAAGKRFILCQSDGGEIFMPEISTVLEQEFGPMGYEISTRVMPKWIVWLLSWVNPEIAGLYPMIDNRIHFDNSLSREILQLDYIPVEQTIVDGGYSLIEHGVIPKTPDYKGRDS